MQARRNVNITRIRMYVLIKSVTMEYNVPLKNVWKYNKAEWNWALIKMKLEEGPMFQKLKQHIHCMYWRKIGWIFRSKSIEIGPLLCWEKTIMKEKGQLSVNIPDSARSIFVLTTSYNFYGNKAFFVREPSD